MFDAIFFRQPDGSLVRTGQLLIRSSHGTKFLKIEKRNQIKLCFHIEVAMGSISSTVNPNPKFRRGTNPNPNFISWMNPEPKPGFEPEPYATFRL